MEMKSQITINIRHNKNERDPFTKWADKLERFADQRTALAIAADIINKKLLIQTYEGQFKRNSHSNSYSAGYYLQLTEPQKKSIKNNREVDDIYKHSLYITVSLITFG